jgi:hypothetical protein
MDGVGAGSFGFGTPGPRVHVNTTPWTPKANLFQASDPAAAAGMLDSVTYFMSVSGTPRGLHRTFRILSQPEQSVRCFSSIHDQHH